MQASTAGIRPNVPRPRGRPPAPRPPGRHVYRSDVAPTAEPGTDKPFEIQARSYRPPVSMQPNMPSIRADPLGLNSTVFGMPRTASEHYKSA